MSSRFPIGVATRYRVPDMLLRCGMILIEGDSAAARLPFTHTKDDKGAARNGNQQADESEEVGKDEKREDNQQRMQTHFRPDDARRQEGHLEQMENADREDFGNNFLRCGRITEG